MQWPYKKLCLQIRPYLNWNEPHQRGLSLLWPLSFCRKNQDISWGIICTSPPISKAEMHYGIIRISSSSPVRVDSCFSSEGLSLLWFVIWGMLCGAFWAGRWIRSCCSACRAGRWGGRRRRRSGWGWFSLEHNLKYMMLFCTASRPNTKINCICRTFDTKTTTKFFSLILYSLRAVSSLRILPGRRQKNTF